MPRDLEPARHQIRQALMARDQAQFQLRLIKLYLVDGLPSETVEQLARQEYAGLPEDVRAWWEKPCTECPPSMPPGHSHN